MPAQYHSIEDGGHASWNEDPSYQSKTLAKNKSETICKIIGLSTLFITVFTILFIAKPWVVIWPVEIEPRLILRPSLSPKHSSQCLSENRASNKGTTKDCGRICKPTLKQLPRPKVYKSCLDGCVMASNFGFSISCSARTCPNSSNLNTEEVEVFCQDPDPTGGGNAAVKLQCYNGAKEGYKTACETGLLKVEEIINDELKSLMDEELKRFASTREL